MRSEEYLRLHDVCRDMAQQCDSGALHDRWLILAQSWLDRAGEADGNKPQRKNARRLDNHATTPVSFGSLAVH
jgi:hypothetical protein